MSEIAPLTSSADIKRLIGENKILREFAPEGQSVGKLCVLVGENNHVLFLVERSELDGPQHKSIKIRVWRAGYQTQHHRIASISLLREVMDETMKKNKESVPVTPPAKSGNVQLFEELIIRAIGNNASDVHFCLRESSNDSCAILNRVDGLLLPLQASIKADLAEHAIAAAYSSADSAGGSAAAFHRKMPIDFAYEINHKGKPVRLRVATTPASDMRDEDGLDVVVRIFHNDGSVASLEKLGYLPSQLHILDMCSKVPSGLFLMVGGTGSGKSTTLRAMFTRDEDRKFRKQYSLEEPVEVKMFGVTQVNVSSIKHKDIPPNEMMAYMVRGLMRLDPDDIMVGEIRDKSTAAAAQSAVDSGHKVLSTIHARDPVQAFLRMLSPAIGMSRELISSPGFITAVVAQKLVTKLCPHCKVQEDRKEVIKKLDKIYIPLQGVFRAKEGGCPHCHHVGLKGRQACSSILIPDMDILQSIGDGKTIDALRQWRSKRVGALHEDNYEGKTTFEHALYCVAHGQIGMDEAEAEMMPFEMAMLREEIIVVKG